MHMAEKAGKPKLKQLSRGQRTHVRRMKEEARRSGIAYKPPFGFTRAAVTPKKDEAPA
jgi:hypothetical protein